MTGAALPSVGSLLRQVRPRLRVSWAAATAQTVAPGVAAAAVGVLLAARVLDLAWAAWAAAAIGATALLAVIVVAAAVRISDQVCARAADRGLATHDAFATALEVSGSDGPLVRRVRDRAEALADGSTAGQAVPVHLRGRRLATSSALAALSVVLVILPNPQNAARSRRAAERAQAAVEGRRLEQAAKALSAAPAASPRQRQVAAQLAAVGRRLERSSSLAQASQAVNQVAATLATQLSPNALSEKAAVRGLDRSLADRPLPGAGNGGAAQQLAAAGAHLHQLDPAAKAALAERLQALAATQSVGDPQAAGHLAAAGAALAAGNGAAATAGLQASAADQAAAATDTVDQASTADAISTLADSQSRLTAPAAPGSQSAQGQGQGSGQGRGQGAGAGRGQGAGSGQGQGQGSGGQGAGGASGPVSGSGAARSNGGTGGTGTPNGTGHNASVGLSQASVYEPVKSGGGPQLNAGGPGNGGPGQVVGTASGPNLATGPGTPLANVLPRYQAQATQALDTLDLPPALRALVESYFRNLAANGG